MSARGVPFPVDVRGLVARAPLGNASQRSPGGIGMFTGALAQQAITRLAQSQDTLFALAKDTGGTALVNYNDLSLGVRQAAAAQTSYYTLGFYSSHTANDGKSDHRHRAHGEAGGLLADADRHRAVCLQSDAGTDRVDLHFSKLSGRNPCQARLHLVANPRDRRT
jgi:hypothetical protein